MQWRAIGLVLLLVGCHGASSVHDDAKEPSLAVSGYLVDPIPPASTPQTLCLTPAMEPGRASIHAALDTWYGAIISYTDIPISPDVEDFLSAVLHELGHQLGIRRHLPGDDQVMHAILPGRGGVKRIPTASDFAALPEEIPSFRVAELYEEGCDLIIFWGDTRYVTASGESIRARCLSLYKAIVCDPDVPWYFFNAS